jgi:hypothetical protein
VQTRLAFAPALTLGAGVNSLVFSLKQADGQIPNQKILSIPLRRTLEICEAVLEMAEEMLRKRNIRFGNLEKSFNNSVSTSYKALFTRVCFSWAAEQAPPLTD